MQKQKIYLTLHNIAAVIVFITVIINIFFKKNLNEEFKTLNLALLIIFLFIGITTLFLKDRNKKW
jgi:heme A synthase